MSKVLVAALYKFVPLADYEALRDVFQERAGALGIRGILLLAHEGINGTIAGEEDAIRTFLEYLRRDPRLSDLVHKESWAEKMPFIRLKVRLKKEIVTIGLPEVDPTAVVGTYVKPKDWNALIRDPEIVLVDTRNDYEVQIGTFRGAIDPRTKSFTEFPEWSQNAPELAGKKKVAMFCTGGIRCEKASSYMLSQGVEEVFHLEGGILKYLEEVPESESLWEGDCFVFDERVSVNHALQPGEYINCAGCRRPVSPEEKQSPQYVEGVSCPRCYDELTPEQRERFMERHLQMRLARERGEIHRGQQLKSKRKERHHAKVEQRDLPILYSFRRCPYAMRARMAVLAAGLDVELREVVLRDKPASMLEISRKGTVPVLQLPDGTVLDESIDIMRWALEQSDPLGWLPESAAQRARTDALIAQNDGEFKAHLDRYKYPTRYEQVDPIEQRTAGERFLRHLEESLATQPYLHGGRRGLLDVAIMPFVRQFANTDRAWFDAAPFPQLQRWLAQELEADCYTAVMDKYPKWEEGTSGVQFPAPAA